MDKFYYSSPLDDANDYRYVAMQIKTFKERECIVPYVVNLAFAIELYLKTILIANRIKYNEEHSLIKLFKLLPIDIKNELLDKDKSLSNFFEEYEKAFVKFRYHYEIYDKKGNKNKLTLSFDNKDAEIKLEILYNYCNEKYSKIDFVQCLENMQ